LGRLPQDVFSRSDRQWGTSIFMIVQNIKTGVDHDQEEDPCPQPDQTH
jgi:hypothetical protein